MKKRGLFFTLGLGIFAFVVLSLSIVASKHFGTYDDRFIELIAFNRMSDLDMSLQESIKEIFVGSTGITVGVMPAQITFEQSLPLDFYKFNSSIERFSNYVTSNDRQISLDFSELRKDLPLRIMPNDVVYSQNISQKSVTITPASFGIDGYSIRINIGNGKNITSCSKVTTAGTHTLMIDVSGSNGTSCTLSSLADITKSNSLDANDVSISTKSDGSISVITQNSNITVSSTVLLQQAGEELPAVYLPYNIIAIDLSRLGLYKASTVKLA